MAPAGYIARYILIAVVIRFAQGLTWYIKPDNGNCSNVKHCNTLDNIINNISHGSAGRDLTLFFLHGIHVLSTQLNLSNMERLSLHGSNGIQTATITCSTHSENGIKLSGIKRVSIGHIKIECCCVSIASQVQAALYIWEVSSLTMTMVRIEESRGYGLCVEEINHTQLTRCHFEHNHGGTNYPGGNTYFSFMRCRHGILAIRQSKFLNGVAYADSNKTHYAAGIHVISNISSFSMSLDNCNIDNNTGRSVMIEMIGSNIVPTNTYVSIYNSNITSGMGHSGAGLSYLIQPLDTPKEEPICTEILTTHVLVIKDTNLANNIADHTAGGMIVDVRGTQCMLNKIKLYNCCFINNSIHSELINYNTGAALLIMGHSVPGFGNELLYSKQDISIAESHFGHNVISSQTGAVVEFIDSQYIEFRNCHFFNNTGSALSLHASSVIFTNNIYFDLNRATFGAAIQLSETSYFFMRNSTTVVFVNNSASQRGGAIYGHRACLDKHDYCFFQPILVKATNTADLESENNMKVIFENNIAVVAGSDIYGGNIDNCYTYGEFYNSTARHPSHYLSGVVFDKITQFPNSVKNKSISSDPCRIVFCDSWNTVKNMHTSPGSTLQVSLQPLGQRNGLTTALIEVVYNDDNILALAVSRSFSPTFTCEEMNITIMSSNATFTTNLTFHLLTSIPIEEVGVPILHVNIQKCPWGLYFNKTTGKCECLPFLSLFYCECQFDFSIRCHPLFHWIGCDNESSCVSSALISAMTCTTYYCNEDANITLGRVNDQCVPGRMGIGCGQCVQNFSAVLGTSNCKPCSNSHLWLIVVYIGSGILLIVLLTAFNINVANGTVNGIIFYVNFIHTLEEIFLPEHFTNSCVPRILIAWLNLDLGIEVCFYNGMTTYQKTWLQIGYIFYIWSLQISIVYLCRKYIFFTRICGRNVTKVLATLLLVSFMKSLRIVQTVLTMTRLSSMTQLSYPNKRHLMWSSNPAIPIASIKHTLLVIAAAVLGLALSSLTLCLLSIQVLKRASNRRGLAWVSRLQPFFEAFTGPCNPNYTFWPGFLFFMRIALILIIHTSHTDLKIPHDMATISCGLSTSVIIFSLLYPSGVYKKWSLNVFELSIMLNLTVLSVANIAGSYRHHNVMQYITYLSIALVLLSTLCYRSKPLCMITVCMKRILAVVNMKRSNNVGEKNSASSAFKVTHSVIEGPTPPNEASPLLNVSSSPHTKSFSDPRETLLESN